MKLIKQQQSQVMLSCLPIEISVITNIIKREHQYNYSCSGLRNLLYKFVFISESILKQNESTLTLTFNEFWCMNKFVSRELSYIKPYAKCQFGISETRGQQLIDDLDAIDDELSNNPDYYEAIGYNDYIKKKEQEDSDVMAKERKELALIQTADDFMLQAINQKKQEGFWYTPEEEIFFRGLDWFKQNKLIYCCYADSGVAGWLVLDCDTLQVEGDIHLYYPPVKKCDIPELVKWLEK